MRRSRVDANHRAVTIALRGVGCSVLSIVPLRKGGDLVVATPGFQKRTLIMEVKDGEKTLSRRRLTEDEETFRKNWKGEWHVVESVDDALRIVREG
jgi:hypothetical protein